MSNLNELKPIINLNPFAKFCCTIGHLPSSYMSSLTYEEQLLWFCDYLQNTIIPAVNNNAECVKELQELYVKLKNYVDNYFENLDVQSEINNKLDEMAEDGTLAQIIEDYATIPELTEKVTKNENNISELQINVNLLKNNFRNSKYMCYIFCDNELRQSISYVTDHLTRCANAGFKESQMLITINNDGTIVEDISKFEEYNQLAKNLNIPITSIKFHGKYTAINYQNTILDILKYFPDVNTVFIFNEQLEDIYNNALSYPSVIKNNFNNVKKVGFTCAYNQAFYGNTLTFDKWQSIINVFDVLGVNMYPSCSSFSNPSICNYEKVIGAFNNPTFICPWTKEIWITESGVLPYWQFMELPENYVISKLTDNTFTTEPQKIFFKALNNCNMAQRATKIIPWFLESGMSDPNHELFDILNNIITGR